MQSWMIGVVSGAIVTGLLPVLPPVQVSLLLVPAGIASLVCQRRLARAVAGLACGCLLGVAWGNNLLAHRLAEGCVGEPLTVRGYIDALPVLRQARSTDKGQQFEFDVGEIEPARCTGPRRLLLFYYGEARVVPGERWQFEVLLRKPWGTANPGAFNMQAWFAQNGVDGVGSVRHNGATRRLAAPRGLRGIQHRHRLWIRERIDQLGLAPGPAAVLRAITVADKSAIDARLWRLFRQFGISHLLVISGLHIGMVAAAGFLVGGVWVRLLGGGATWLPGVAALVSASLFSALAGLSLPTQRALFMLGSFVVARLFARRPDGFDVLLLAAVACLLVNPLAAVGAGFWLSFGSVAALLWLARWQGRMGWAGRLIGTHVYMALFMLPLGALFFGGASLVATLANLVMIPLVGWYVVPLGLLGSVCFLCGWPVDRVFWALAVWPLEQLLPAVGRIADGAGPALYAHLHSPLPHALLGVLAVCLLILPGAARLRALALLCALPALLPSRPATPEGAKATSVTVLDVGQGTSVVIRAGERALLYDVGGGDPSGDNMGTRVVLPYLRAQGVNALDTVVISHRDLDHSAGTGAVLDALPVARFRYGGEVDATRGGRPCRAGEAWRWPGGQAFQFLSPAGESPVRSNNNSCVLQVTVGDFRLLLPGDIEADRERALVQYWGATLASNWLLVAHHGSGTSSSTAFLKHVAAVTAVVSSGYANRFGHPNPAVVRRLEAAGVNILNTAVEGALAFSITPGEPLVSSAYRRHYRHYWM